MNHPEVLIVPVLMLADYFLTLYAASLIGGDAERRAAYELNPRFKEAVGAGRWFNPLHLFATALATLALWLLGTIVGPGQFNAALGLMVGAWSVLIGTHLANILLMQWLRGSPGAIEGTVSTSGRFRLMNTVYLSLGLAVLPLVVTALFEPGPFVVGAALGAALVSLTPLLWGLRTDPAQLDRRHTGVWQRTCSFCGRGEAELKFLLAAERANICDECVATSAEALAEAGAAQPDAPPPGFGRKGLTPPAG